MKTEGSCIWGVTRI